MQAAFYKGTRPGFSGLFNRAVRWWTGGPYSHCELIIDSDGRRARCASSANLDGGVRIKIIDLDPARWDILTFNADAAAVEQWFNQHQGDAYDLIGLLGFVWRRRDGDRRRWFCSEAIAAAIGLPEPWRFCPNTLAAVLRRHMP